MDGHLIVCGKVNIINTCCSFFHVCPIIDDEIVVTWLKCCAFGSVNKL